MASRNHDCPKCQRKMEPGHVPDMGHGIILQSSWSPGMPVTRRFFGGINYNKKHLIPLIAWRCSRCGYVELYAEGL